MEILTLPIKKKWFDMILSGEKKEEYREIKDYWARRFSGSREEIEWQCWEEMIGDMKSPYLRHLDSEELLKYFGVYLKKFAAFKFRNGYRADSPSFIIKSEGINIKTGREDWGAEKGKYYFTLCLGEIIQR